MKRRKLMLFAALLSMAFTVGAAGKPFAKTTELSSDKCIKCHTDFERMDKFGAAAAEGAGASIAG